jgi:alanine-glyoxylate transaminase/serine-glyoxylate transaminase/serine-pyruvate transaminase
MLKQVFNTSGDMFLIPGTGSCGNDALLGSAFSSGEKVIVGINGFFGERLRAIARGNGLQVVTVDEEWGKPFDPAAFEAALARHPDAAGVCVVHLETSTTIINPVDQIGPLVRGHGKAFMVDAVSSVGGMPLLMDEWQIDLCATATQKCLGAPPGLAPTAVGPRGWEFIDRDPDKGHGWYTDLRVWRTYAIDWADWHPFPITMATSNVLALRASLNALIAEGIEKRMARYRALAMQLREGLRLIGMQPFTPDELMAPVITAAYGPEGVPTSRIVAFLAQEHGIKIAGGLGALKDKVFRIGHMAPTTTENEIERVLDALARFKSA